MKFLGRWNIFGYKTPRPFYAVETVDSSVQRLFKKDKTEGLLFKDWTQSKVVHMRGACPGFVHLTDSGAWGGKAFKTELKCSFCEGKKNKPGFQKHQRSTKSWLWNVSSSWKSVLASACRSQIFEKPLLTFSVQSSEQIQNVLLTASLASLPTTGQLGQQTNTSKKKIKKVYYLTLEVVREIFKRVGVDVTWNSLSKKRKEAEETRGNK